tara:strand:- start:382 stop:747 length:366 start_codon:yes stop_codon:yes gene_type:complete
MPNVFKLKSHKAMPSASSSNDIETLYTVPHATATTTIVLGLILCNIHTSQVNVSVKLHSTTSDSETNEDVWLLHNVPVPAGSSLELLSGGKVVMKSNDYLQIKSSTDATIDAALSIMEQTA